VNCQALVELVTDYLERALEAKELERFEEHIALCPDCAAYLDGMRQTLRALGTIPPESLSPRAREELLEAFRGWSERPVSQP